MSPASSTPSPARAPQVAVERRGPVAVLRFHNPPDGTIANRGAAELTERLGEVLADAAVRAVVLTGAQRGVFVRHADVGQIERAAQALIEGRIEPRHFVDGAFPRLGRTIEQADKPVIAAIDGVCMGGGFEIALCCTARIASAAATHIGLPEIRLGLFPGAGGTQRLARLIGAHRARLLMLQGTVVDAAQALALGLIDELVPDALTRAVELGHALARRPAAAVAALLRLTREPSGQRLEEEQIAFAELLRDDAQTRATLRAFVAGAQQLDQLD